MAIEQQTTGNKDISIQLRSESIAYAMQHGLLSVAANFYEPFINMKVQQSYVERFARHRVPAGWNEQNFAGRFGKNFFGEIVGDLSGFGTLVVAEALFPSKLHSCTRAMRAWIDPLYTSVAHRVFADERNDPEYDRKVKQWTTFQEQNLVRSAIMMTAGLVGNVAAQKAVRNPAPVRAIFLGKLASSAVTTGVGLTTRIAFPDQMKSVDSWLGKNIFSPMINRVEDTMENGAPISHADRLGAHRAGAAELQPAR
ncbi:MAG: hypothetical protein ACN2B6_05470 [Rickettsiales bacterium]